MGLPGSDHCIVDHCSISWTIDEAFSSRNGKNITLQRTLISEALNVAGHQNYPAGTAHGYAASISGDIGSFHHNLLAHCEGRNWSLAGGLDAARQLRRPARYLQQRRLQLGRPHDRRRRARGELRRQLLQARRRVDAVFVALNAQYDNFPGTQQYYFTDNVMPGHFDENNQDSGPPGRAAARPRATARGSRRPSFRRTRPCNRPATPTRACCPTSAARSRSSTTTTCAWSRRRSNGTFTYRGSVSGKPGLPDNEADVGGYESYPTTTRDATWDSDGDGLPDWWEKTVRPQPVVAGRQLRRQQRRRGRQRLHAARRLPAVDGEAALLHQHRQDRGRRSRRRRSSATPAARLRGLGRRQRQVAISGKTATFTPTRCGLASWRVTVTGQRRQLDEQGHGRLRRRRHRDLSVRRFGAASATRRRRHRRQVGAPSVRAGRSTSARG